MFLFFLPSTKQAKSNICIFFSDLVQHPLLSPHTRFYAPPSVPRSSLAATSRSSSTPRHCSQRNHSLCHGRNGHPNSSNYTGRHCSCHRDRPYDCDRDRSRDSICSRRHWSMLCRRNKHSFHICSCAHSHHVYLFIRFRVPLV